ncbi:MAG: ATPase [Candidatus Taylorbacteria bacterium RIFCSPLOWO2_01_FULL_44_26]|uniref:ATPase n=2 Tax=Candidatus Tayloriibacteriota TaxID=1817919 RepID=A0A1G2MMV1_9BACT|nr:MAG: ATPase [Candidatus Taylorbacteria bacterium RIFCSPHIGHO2_02_FULL_44_12]OHA30814.1 MAG: ATPase [Candidatus Taylorbacteria bacterium RIFCSPLOWO2_01_FULL_44_26]
MLQRHIQKAIEEGLFKNKVIVIYGARQVGKTTLVKEIQKKYKDQSLYLNCDEPDIKDALTDKTSTQLKAYFGNSRLVIIDEAQRVKNIGLTLKLAFDTFPDIQIIATGSSSFDLANKVVEPLTGRKREFFLPALSVAECTGLSSPVEFKRMFESRMIFGMYPGVVLGDSREERKNIEEIARSYLYKDILEIDTIRNPEGIKKLLKALALQIGNEVSYNELALTVGINKRTVEKYIQILEQAFIIFRLKPYYKNARNELTRLRKIYFYDLGIRNALINNFNAFDSRNDIGAMWENFVISERMKKNNLSGMAISSHFWRTIDGREIDYLEENGNILSAYEIKWSGNGFSAPKVFSDNYPQSTYAVITKENLFDFVG